MEKPLKIFDMNFELIKLEFCYVKAKLCLSLNLLQVLSENDSVDKNRREEREGKISKTFVYTRISPLPPPVFFWTFQTVIKKRSHDKNNKSQETLQQQKNIEDNNWTSEEF